MKSISKADLFVVFMDMFPCNLYWKDNDGRYLGCNKAQAEFHSLITPEEIVGKTEFDLLPRHQAEEVIFMDQSILKNETYSTSEETIKLPNQTERIFLSKKIPIRDDEGKVVGLAGISFDITAEKERDQLKREIEQAQLKIQFTKQAAGSIAHDLRTPLAAISNYLSLLKEEMPQVFEGYGVAREAKLLEGRKLYDADFAVYAEAFDSIKQAVEYSNHYINMILGNLKHDTIKTDAYQTFMLLDVVKKAVEDYPYNGSEKQFLHLNADTDFQIWGDTFYITNIVNNLLKNAFYFLRAAGKGEIHIWLETGDRENYLHVKDTAKGAPKEVCEKMFGAYFSAREGGTGLGLAFCKSIMQSFGGDIRAESVEGEYMHFVLQFPVR